MIWYLSGSRPAAARWNSPGSSLRRARSPVAPNTTMTWLSGRRAADTRTRPARAGAAPGPRPARASVGAELAIVVLLLDQRQQNRWCLGQAPTPSRSRSAWWAVSCLSLTVAAVAELVGECGVGRVPAEFGSGLGRASTLIEQEDFGEIVAEARPGLLLGT